jgi:hypothetical protein
MLMTFRRPIPIHYIVGHPDSVDDNAVPYANPSYRGSCLDAAPRCKEIRSRSSALKEFETGTAEGFVRLTSRNTRIHMRSADISCSPR